MPSYARINNGVVAETLDTDQDIKAMFHPDLIWVPCGREVLPGWVFDQCEFTLPPPPVLTAAETRQDILDQIVALEAGQDRALREAALTGDLSRLQTIDDTVAALRRLL